MQGKSIRAQTVTLCRVACTWCLLCSGAVTAQSAALRELQAAEALRTAQPANERAQEQSTRDAGLLTSSPRRSVDGIELSVTTGHAGSIRSISFSADNRYVVSSDANEMKVWDVASHHEVRTFAATHLTEAPLDVRLSPDGQRLLQSLGFGQQGVTVFDCSTGRAVASALLISDDARVSVSAAALDVSAASRSGAAPGLLITDLLTGRQNSLRGATAMTPLALSAHGDTLLTSEFDVSMNSGGIGGMLANVASGLVPGMAQTASIPDQRIRVVAWDLHSLRKLVSVPTSLISNTVAIDATGKLLAVENPDRSVDGYELPSGRKHRIIPADPKVTGPSLAHDTLLFAADATRLARVGRDGAVDIYEISGRALASFPAGKVDAAAESMADISAVHPSAQFSADGRLFALAHRERVQVWDIAGGNSLLKLRASAIALSSDGRSAILARLGEGAPILHDLGTGKQEFFASHVEPIAQVQMSADGVLAIGTAQRGGGKFWDLATGQMLGEVPACASTAPAMAVRASPTENLLAIKCEDGSAELWELLGKRIAQLSPPLEHAAALLSRDPDRHHARHYYSLGEDVQFSADGRLLAIASAEQVTLWDTTTHDRVAQVSTSGLPIPAQLDELTALRRAAEISEVSPFTDSKTLKMLGKNQRELYAAMANEQSSGVAEQWRQTIASPQYQEELRQAQLQIADIAIDSANHRLALVRAGEVSLWDFKSGRQLRVLPAPAEGMRMVGGIAFSADGRQLYGPNSTRWDLTSGELRSAAISDGPEAMSAEVSRGLSPCCDAGLALSPDGTVLARGVGLMVQLSDAKSGLLLGELTGHTHAVSSVTFAHDGKTLLSGSLDGSLRVWDVASRKEIVALYGLGAGSYIAITPDQYYRVSKSRLAGISFRMNGQLYPFEQFDLRFNRPDLLAERLGRASTAQIAEFRRLRERRLRKMGFTEDRLDGELHMPDVQILGAPAPAATANSTLLLSIRASDDRYALDRINVYVNDVPIFGTAGLVLKDRQAHKEERQIEVALAAGANKVQVSVLNQQGAESLRQTVYIRSTSVPHSDVYIVAIGVSSYQNPKYNLRYAAKDAADLMRLYQGSQFGNGQVHLLDLTNEKATRASIARAREWLAQAKPNDLAIVFAAGHGMIDERNEYYFGTYDIDPEQPQINGLPYEEFESLLDGIAALKKLLLLDTCFSGELESDQPVALAAGDKAEGIVKMRAFRILPSAGTSAPSHRGTAATAEAEFGSRRFEDVFADLRRGTGAVVISSASGDEYALEGERWNNGVFTYAVLKGLKDGAADANQDGVVTVGELQSFVIDEVRKLTAGGQHPTVRQENLDFDFQVY